MPTNNKKLKPIMYKQIISLQLPLRFSVPSRPDRADQKAYDTWIRWYARWEMTPPAATSPTRTETADQRGSAPASLSYWCSRGRLGRQSPSPRYSGVSQSGRDHRDTGGEWRSLPGWWPPRPTLSGSPTETRHIRITFHNGMWIWDHSEKLSQKSL